MPHPLLTATTSPLPALTRMFKAQGNTRRIAKRKAQKMARSPVAVSALIRGGALR